MEIRTASPADARGIATVRIAGWRAAYEGLVPDAVLARQDPEREAGRRRQRWEEIHADPRFGEFVAVIDQKVVGWVVACPGRDDDAGEPPMDPGTRDRAVAPAVGVGELAAIYVLPQYLSTGLGHALLAVAERHLVSCGYRHAYLWVLDGNARASRFYARHHWWEDGGKKFATVGDAELPVRRRVRDLTVPWGDDHAVMGVSGSP